MHGTICCLAPFYLVPFVIIKIKHNIISIFSKFCVNVYIYICIYTHIFNNVVQDTDNNVFGRMNCFILFTFDGLTWKNN